VRPLADRLTFGIRRFDSEESFRAEQRDSVPVVSFTF
jgi:hypothetical protein